MLSSGFYPHGTATVHRALTQDSRVLAGQPSAPKYFPFTLRALHEPRLIKRFHGATDSVRLCDCEWTKVMKVSRSSNFYSELDLDNFDISLNTGSPSGSQRLNPFAKTAFYMHSLCCIIFHSQFHLKTQRDFSCKGIWVYGRSPRIRRGITVCFSTVSWEELLTCLLRQA